MSKSPATIGSALALEVITSSADQSPQQRLDQVARASDLIASELIQFWGDPTYPKQDCLIRAASVLACRPSIEAVVESKPQTTEITHSVSQNFRDLGKAVLSTPVLSPRYLGRHNNVRKPEITGQLSELAVLGALWACIGQGYFSRGSYALPATSEQDSGTRVNGYSTGTDIMLKRSGTKKKQPIQVKTAITDNNLEKVAQYDPRIAVMTPGMLINSSRHNAARELLVAATTNDRKQLYGIYNRIEATFEAAKMRSEAERQYHQNTASHTDQKSALERYIERTTVRYA